MAVLAERLNFRPWVLVLLVAVFAVLGGALVRGYRGQEVPVASTGPSLEQRLSLLQRQVDSLSAAVTKSAAIRSAKAPLRRPAASRGR
jgi:uncharacterized small protein (DUF1192 family)